MVHLRLIATMRIILIMRVILSKSDAPKSPTYSLRLAYLKRMKKSSSRDSSKNRQKQTKKVVTISYRSRSVAKIQMSLIPIQRWQPKMS